MFESLPTLPVYAWVLLAIVAIIIAIIAIVAIIIAIIAFWKEVEIDPATGLPIEEPDTDNTDIITCSVPGQKPIVFNPEQHKSYSVDSYDWFVEIELVNWNLCYVPFVYTTIIDQSFNSVSEKKAV